MLDSSGRVLIPADLDAAGVTDPAVRRMVSDFVAASPMRVRTVVAGDGRAIDQISFSGRPPKDFRVEPAKGGPTRSAVADVPAFLWAYGCAPTAAAMLIGYYDRRPAWPKMYTGPSNGGLMPLDDASWGGGECPLSVTHQGIDGRVKFGHVDDFWVGYGSAIPDPYITGSWAPHEAADCVGDFMGTSQSAFGNTDGATSLSVAGDGSPVWDYSGAEPHFRDGCHGLRLFVESRGYTVTANYSQRLLGYHGNTLGFTYDQFKQEIDSGHPVLLLMTDHMMVAWAYDAGTDTIHVHDTWDYQDHTMTWGTSYAGLAHFGVTVLVPSGCVCSASDQCCDGCGPINNDAECDDGSACTHTDLCQGGKCVGTDAVVCPLPVDECHDSICDPSTGSCTNPNTEDGTPCVNGPLCMQSSACEAGVCTGVEPVACAPLDACHSEGTCDPTTGQCSHPLLPDGTPCPAGACTGGYCWSPPSGGDQASSPDDASATDSSCGVRSAGATSGSSRRAQWSLALLATVLAAHRARRSRGCAKRRDLRS